MDSKVYISVTETAKIIRQELKKRWPHVKFSVKSKSYTGGANVSLLWREGPTMEHVKEAVQMFEGSTFDAMQDLKEYRSVEWQGRRVHFGADCLHLNRSITNGREKAKLAEELVRIRCHFEQVPGGERFGRWSPDELADKIVYGQDYEAHESLNEAFERIVLNR